MASTSTRIPIVHLLAATALCVSCASGQGTRGSKIGLGGKDVRVPLDWLDAPGRGRPEFGQGPGDYGRRFSFEREPRFYEMHVPPSYDGKSSVPVVMVFHGGGGYPAGARYQSGMDKVSNKEGFIVLYPAGTGSLFKDRLLVWNDGRKYKDGSKVGANDVGYVLAMLEDAEKLFRLDRQRVYACGMSNGAQFTYTLAKKIPEQIAAIACVAGHRPADYIYKPPSLPMPVMQFAGKLDELAPYEGGGAKEGKEYINKFDTELASVETVIESWRKQNKCPEKPAETRRVGRAVMQRYGPGTDGAEVVLWTLEDCGHTWPGSTLLPGEKRLGVGRVSRDISASEEMWEFFKRHRRK